MTATTGTPGPAAGREHSTDPREDPIRTEIAGTVLRVDVEVGDFVAEGDVIALLESMKMEIPVIAETTGTIAQIMVTENSTVGVDDIIATVVDEPHRDGTAAAPTGA
ncbi:MAG: acetyl-CoA carboxylase biotin carboxyl carrier protein subunit [Pseudonocardia sp.]|nr:acetyl-CoA carboxylase biotin carboxyl carrier protein subunit [Pseudonocardia sp.]